MSTPPSHQIPPEIPHERHAEFVEALTRAHGRLLGYLMAILGRRSDAEDVLQRASVLMWRKFDDFAPGSDFVAWASTFCFYEAKNYLRLAARSPLVFDENLLSTLAHERLDDLPHRERRLGALEHCFSLLGRREQDLIRSAYLENQGIASLAAGMNRAPQTLYNKLNHLRRILAECVQKKLAEDLP
jgi:RNA polymerase sigma-70 factor (ECF subfamily)